MTQRNNGKGEIMMGKERRKGEVKEKVEWLKMGKERQGK